MSNKRKLFYLNALVRGTEFKEDQTEFDFIITSDKVDTYRTVFTHKGWDFDRYKDNPVVFYQHRSHDDEPDNLIGITVKGPWAEKLDDGTRVWIARVRFEPKELNKKAEKIRKKIIARTLRMASIGADVHAYHWGDEDKGEDVDTLYFTRKELFEWSVVTVGANAAASVRSNKKFMRQVRSEKPGFKKAKKKNTKTAKRNLKKKAKRKADKKAQKNARTAYKRNKKIGFNTQAARLEIAKNKFN